VLGVQLLAPLAALALSNGSLRSLRCSPGSRRLRRIRRNDCIDEPAQFLTRFVGTNCRSAARTSRRGSRSEPAYFVVARRQKRVRSLLLSTAVRDPGLADSDR
jgi:hypothetical protein